MRRVCCVYRPVIIAGSVKTLAGALFAIDADLRFQWVGATREVNSLSDAKCLGIKLYDNSVSFAKLIGANRRYREQNILHILGTNGEFNRRTGGAPEDDRLGQ